MKVSDLFLRCLEVEGVGVIFGVPGEENADLMISLLDSKIEFVICRHEQGAAFMADMYGRLTGMPGVCLSTLGPGATNLATGVGSANMDHAPLVAIVGQASTKRLHKESHQNMDAIAMFQPITKWATTILDAGSITEVIRKAFKLAMAEKPGAVVIELPEDIAKEEIDLQPVPPRGSSHHGGVELVLVVEALKLIAESKKPLILAGNGVVRAEAGGELTEFVDKTGIWAATTFMGKGAISARHELCLYCVGLGARDIALCAFEESDLVICIGYDMVEWHPDCWNVGKEKRIIHIDTRPAEVDKNYVADVDIQGDIGDTLRKLIEGLGPEHKKDVERWADAQKTITAELNKHDEDDSFPVKPQRLVSDIRAVMGDEDILISDVGAHKIWIARHYRTFNVKTCFITNGFCSMGFALPSAFAAKRLYPEKNVVAVSGDGGFMMNVQELATAVQYKVPIVVMIWEDNSYGLIAWKQEASYHKTSHTELQNPDFVKLAESFGGRGIRIKKAGDLQPALKSAFQETERPTVIVAPVDYSENIKLTEQLGQLVCWVSFG